MGDAADWLRECEQNAYTMHIIGECRDYCHYCYEEAMRDQPSNPIAVKLFRTRIPSKTFREQKS